MLVYILFFIFIAILAIDYEFNQTRSDYLPVFVAFSLAMLAGFRHPDIARDYEGYTYAFEAVYKNNDPLIYAILEPGFVLIVNIFRTIFTYNYGLMIMLGFALASIFLKVISIRSLSLNPYLVILFYFSHYFMLQEMTQIRIGLASAIFFISINYYLKGKIKAYIALILLATFFHYTAILYLGVLFLKRDSFNRYLYSFILLLSVAISFFKIPMIGYLSNIQSNEYSTKLDNYVFSAAFLEIKVLNAVTICNILCCLYLIVAVAPGGFSNDKKLSLFLKCNILSIFLLSFFSGVPSMAFRLSEIFGILSMFTFAYLARYLPAQKYNIFITIIIAAIFFYFFVLTSGLIQDYKVVDII